MSVAIIAGSSKGIGLALAHQILASCPKTIVFAASRTPSLCVESSRHLPSQQRDRLKPVQVNITQESDISGLAATISKEYGPKSVKQVWMVAGTLTPEKSLRSLKEDLIWEHLRLNTVAPMLAAKHWSPLLAPPIKKVEPGSHLVGLDQSWWINISARTGSIGDNKLGGWYSYRISKAGLNQLTRTMAIELGRNGIGAVSLHPGTVDTDLSRPYTASSHSKFSASESAAKMYEALTRLKSTDSGGFFDYKGDPIVW
ncbi:hypothetical protein BDR26DRAFT_840598 [Obelidium mucronatum]|nr:hypothetical protein BDR26DRAFT_840598 [Obelidium mucronatum]